jgi:integrase
MGHLHRRGGTWYLRLKVAGEPKEISLRTGNKREAEAEADKHRAIAAAKTAEDVALHVGRARKVIADAKKKATPVADAWRLFEEHPRRPKPGALTWRDYGIIWSKFKTWTDARGTRFLNDISEADAGAFLDSVDGLSPNRYNKYLVFLRKFFAVMLEKGLPNPFAEVEPRPLAPEHHRALTKEELLTILGKAEGELRLLLCLGAYGALRLTDAVNLAWKDVDLAHGFLRVTPSKTRRLAKAISVPMHPEIRTLLEIVPPRQRNGLVLPGLAAKYKKDRGAVSALVSRHFKNCDIKTTGTRTEGKKAVSLASFHALRTTWVSLAAEAGVPLGVVQAICGHGSPAVQRYYLRVGDEAARAAVESLPMLTAAPPDPLAELRAACHAAIDQVTEKQLKKAAKALKVEE